MLIDLRDRLFCILLELNNVKIRCRLQDIHQIMPDALHLLRPYLCRTDVHVLIDLHGIRGDDLAVYCLRERYG